MGWIYRPVEKTWTLVRAGRLEITIGALVLEALCTRTGLNRRDALRWVASRPRRALA